MPEHTFGPDRIQVGAIPSGATLDVSGYLTRVLLDLVRDEAGALHDITEQDEFADADRARGVGDSWAAARRDQLVEELVERLAPRLPVYGGEVSGLASALTAVAARRNVPAQREGGEAA